ncbi:MAG: DoxX family membrane protein [Woeseiaceae bacterium]|nr:DoxX family membrane protein [Woeseiaceae bacterium]
MSNLDDFRAARLATWPLVLLRVYTGVFFLYFGIVKVIGGVNVEGFLNAVSDNTFGFYRPVVENVILPASGVFGFLVTAGEVLLGISLILGLATRYASFLGAFMVLNFWFAKGQGILDAQNHDVIWFVILVVLGGLHAGRTMGLDQKLGGRYGLLA